jgi:cob(I)alamin adenosyltransferase
MANRLTRIYTKTGDNGDTGLSTGLRVRKSCPQIHAIGEIDELNSVIGIVVAYDIPPELKEIFIHIQHQLFNLGAELNNADLKFMNEHIVKELEERIDSYNKSLPPLKNFILPGGGHASAACHLARTVCRRAERSVVMLSEEQELNSYLQIYLNRLSDFLFVICRVLAKHAGEKETLWSSKTIAQETYY